MITDRLRRAWQTAVNTGYSLESVCKRAGVKYSNVIRFCVSNGLTIPPTKHGKKKTKKDPTDPS